MRTLTPFNDEWLFAPRELDDRAPDSDFERVTLPHTNLLLPHHNFDNAEYQFISTYRKRFRMGGPRQGRRAYIDFDGVMIAARVAINGHILGEHDGGYTPFTFELTDYLTTGDNLLTVWVDSTERPDIPPYGHVVDYLTFGGIYRDVTLRVVDACHIADVFVKPYDVLTNRQKLDVDVTVRNQSEEAVRGVAVVVLDIAYDPRNTIEMYAGVMGTPVEVAPMSETTVTVRSMPLPQLSLWSPDEPNLHSLRVTLELEGRESPADEVRNVRFGLREARFDPDGSFYFNGKPLKLFGLNRHQTFPYIGAAAPKRLQRKDADILKYELGCNIVRTSHYPQSPYFIDRCDEIGLLVFEEIPGWQHIGDQDWMALSLRDVEAMIKRDRNHPSIVLWGVRINESLDNTALYTATNELAHRLDPTRQTGGVRNFLGSELLEDVYTFNDFSNTVLEPEVTPHMITEFNGHMFPTKSFDNEDRAVEHALRHARIHNLIHGNPRVAGGTGWCAFDYNTHYEFGSGDRICYHGVMDIFRLPKFAAYFYESQLPPSVRPVLRAATYWTRGDRAEGGNDPLTIFSNCDEIAIYMGEALHGRYRPDRARYPHLPYPPFTVPGLSLAAMSGQAFQDLRVVGYLDGEVVIEEMHAADGLPKTLVLALDDAEIAADGADMTRLVFKIVDSYGNRLPFATAPVSFTLEGDADLIGENPFPLVGGQAALYVKARETPGTVMIRASAPRLPDAEVTLTLV